MRVMLRDKLLDNDTFSPLSKLNKESGYRFVKADKRKAVLQMKSQTQQADLCDYLREVYRYDLFLQNYSHLS